MGRAHSRLLALGEQDRHLVDAINAHPERPVAVSMKAKGKKELRGRQAGIWGKLETDDVFFFDAATHPLGSPDLTRKSLGFDSGPGQPKTSPSAFSRSI